MVASSRLGLLLAGFVLFAIPVLVFAHGGATGVVKTRMEAMEGIAKSMKLIGRMLKGDAAYDATAIASAASSIRDHAGTELTELFPKDSLAKPTEALPTIWQDWDEFSEMARRLGVASVALVTAANNPRSERSSPVSVSWTELRDERSLADQPPELVFSYLARTCADCHESFRQKKD